MQKEEAKAPDFVGKVPIAIWKNKDKNGKDYVTLKLFGTTFNLWKNEPKITEEKIEG
ncbi:MAG: hypothetical protein WC413_01540 [Candidatus Nanoarchaeia archaeon]